MSAQYNIMKTTGVSYYISVDVERHLHLFFYNKGDRRSGVIPVETYKKII